jgi:signal peptide peptidase SppA
MSGCKINYEILSVDPQWFSLFRAGAIGDRVSRDRQRAERAVTPKKIAGGVGVINIRGPLSYGASFWTELFDLPDYETIGGLLDSAIADDGINSIVLRIQSPGGTAFGASELGEKIFSARQQKKIIAIADPYAFSAAYQIGSAASEFYTVKSGMVGSVGAYVMHVDYSEALKNDGVKVSFVSAGEKKVDGNEFEPLSDSAKADIQAEVDRFYRVFVSDVARNRGISDAEVLENFGKGGRVMSTEALQNRMIDGISSFEALVARELSAIYEASEMARSRAFVERERLLLSLED